MSEAVKCFARGLARGPRSLSSRLLFFLLQFLLPISAATPTTTTFTILQSHELEVLRGFHGAKVRVLAGRVPPREPGQNLFPCVFQLPEELHSLARGQRVEASPHPDTKLLPSLQPRASFS